MKKSTKTMIIISIIMVLIILIGYYFFKTMVTNKLKTDTSTDYSKKENWVAEESEGTKDVDVFFIYPTLLDTSDNGDFSTIKELEETAKLIYNTQASVYSESANIYMPLYRQMTFKAAEKCNAEYEKYLEVLKNNVPYQDIETALDYYFENYNQGKPFILAGHSQGSALVLDVLTNYMQKHPEYLKRMVAAYPIGFAPSEKMINNYPNLKFATGETECGVIISWNTEGPNAEGKSILLPDDPMVINPLNWKKDDTYAGIELNKGSLDSKTMTIVNGKADAQINNERKTLICTTINEWAVAKGIFSTDSLHVYDYSLYYNNLKENVVKRINTYKEINNIK